MNTNNEPYDYNTPIEKTSVELAKMIVAKLDAGKDFMIIENFEKADPLVKANFIEKSTDFSIEVLREMSKSDIPFAYATKSIEKIIQVLESLRAYIDGTVSQARHEFASRTFGVRSPANGKYREEDVTLGLLLLKLEELRESQGNNKADYFNELPTEAAAEKPAEAAIADLSTAAPAESTSQEGAE